MWPFRRNEPPTPLSYRIDTLERDFKGLRLEWEEMYDKLHHLMARIARRQAILRKAQAEQDGEEGAQEALHGPNLGLPGMDPISQSILSRRRRGGLHQQQPDAGRS